MKIALAQIRSSAENIDENIQKHIKFIYEAVTEGAKLIIFPELSLTGYEPALAGKLAFELDDDRLRIFQGISNERDIIIGVGIPLKTEGLPCISICVFHPYQHRQIYSKRYLHPDEEIFFMPGQENNGYIRNCENICISICYEASIPDHPQHAHLIGTAYYINSSAKWAHNIDKGLMTLSNIAKTYQMTVFMVNYVGMMNGDECVGKSTVWDAQGQIIDQMNDWEEGLLIYDTVCKSHT